MHQALAVGPLDSVIPLKEEEKPSEQYPRWCFLVAIVVIVERADRQSVAVFSPIFEGGSEEWRLAFALQSNIIYRVQACTRTASFKVSTRY
jgi:hypothetical protein